MAAPGRCPPTSINWIPDALRHLLIGQERELVWRQTKIERLTHELALHKHHRSGVRGRRLSTEQAQLFEETARPIWRR